MGIVRRAFFLARSAHRGQTRAQGTPYVTHPVRVARILRREYGIRDPEVLAAALLHDVVEDTAVTLDDLAPFGPRVAAAAAALTRLPHEPLRDYWARAAANADAYRIKLADRLDNLADLPHMPDSARRAHEWRKAQRMIAFLCRPEDRPLLERALWAAAPACVPDGAGPTPEAVP